MAQIRIRHPHQMVEFLHQLDLKLSLVQKGFNGKTTENLMESDDIFDQELGLLLESLGYETYEECINDIEYGEKEYQGY